jgi:hypothetical protein
LRAQALLQAYARQKHADEHACWRFCVACMQHLEHLQALQKSEMWGSAAANSCTAGGSCKARALPWVILWPSHIATPPPNAASKRRIGVCASTGMYISAEVTAWMLTAAHVACSWAWLCIMLSCKQLQGHASRQQAHVLLHGIQSLRGSIAVS